MRLKMNLNFGARLALEDLFGEPMRLIYIKEPS